MSAAACGRSTMACRLSPVPRVRAPFFGATSTHAACLIRPWRRPRTASWSRAPRAATSARSGSSTIATARVLYAVAYRIVGQRADAEEVVLEAFAQAWREATRFEAGRGSVAGWLTMIARSRALDLVRARSRRDRITATAAAERPEHVAGDERLPAGSGEGARSRRAAATGAAGARDPDPAPAAGDRAGLLRGAVAVGDRRAAPGAARHGEDPGAARHAEAARVACGPSTSSAAHEPARPRHAAAISPRPTRSARCRPRRRARSRRSSPTSPEAQREVAEYREVAALLALGGEEAAPGDATCASGCWRGSARRKDAGAAARPAPLEGTRRRLWLALAASLLAAVGLGAGWSRRGAGSAAIETELARAATGRWPRRARSSPSARPPSTRSSSPASSCSSSPPAAIPSPASSSSGTASTEHAIVTDTGSSRCRAGQAYQLWFIKDGKPVPSVTFKPEPRTATAGGADPRADRRHGQRRGGHRRAGGRLAAADLAHPAGGSAAEVVSTGVHQRGAMAQRGSPAALLLLGAARVAALAAQRDAQQPDIAAERAEYVAGSRPPRPHRSPPSRQQPIGTGLRLGPADADVPLDGVAEQRGRPSRAGGSR